MRRRWWKQTGSLVLLAATGLLGVWTLWSAPFLAIASGVSGRRDAATRGMVYVLAALLGVVGLWIAIADLALSAWPIVRLGLVVVSLLVPYEIGRHLRDRVGHRELGWQLAEAVEMRERARIQEARARERGRIAGEMHDSLGHDVAMIALQCSALEARVAQRTQGSSELRDDLAALRRSAAAVVERLHEVVTLLEAEADQIARTSPTVVGAVERARDAGMDVTADLDEAGLADLDDEVGRAAVRVVEEGLTNAAVHAPGGTVTVKAVRDDERLLIEVRDRGSEQRSATNGRSGRGSGGRGLPSLQALVGRLGGVLEHAEHAGGFTLAAHLPLVPSVPTTNRSGHRSDDDPGASRWAELRTGAALRERASRRLVLVVPAAIVLATAVVLLGAFVYLNVASVLPAERAALVPIGATSDAVDSLLPTVEMPDAPRSRDGCRYYEAAVSFFERVDVHEVCLADGRVASVTTIEPRTR